MNMKIFEDERSLFQQKINALAGNGTTQENIDNLVKQLINPKKDDVGNRLESLYDQLGIQKFSDLVDAVDAAGGGIFVFPTPQTLADNIQQVLIYHKQLEDERVTVAQALCDEQSSVLKIQNKINQLKKLNTNEVDTVRDDPETNGQSDIQSN